MYNYSQIIVTVIHRNDPPLSMESLIILLQLLQFINISQTPTGSYLLS